MDSWKIQRICTILENSKDKVKGTLDPLGVSNIRSARHCPHQCRRFSRGKYRVKGTRLLLLIKWKVDL